MTSRCRMFILIVGLCVGPAACHLSDTFEAPSPGRSDEGLDLARLDAAGPDASADLDARLPAEQGVDLKDQSDAPSDLQRDLDAAPKLDLASPCEGLAELATGLEEAPFPICDQRDLRLMLIEPSAHFELKQDITLDESWQPLPTFSGSLNGNGFSISGLTLDQDTIVASELRRAVLACRGHVL